MSVTKIEINGKDYKIECKAGEEKLLFNAVNMINEKIKSSNELKKLSESKMFLIISLMPRILFKFGYKIYILKNRKNHTLHFSPKLALALLN